VARTEVRKFLGFSIFERRERAAHRAESPRQVQGAASGHDMPNIGEKSGAADQSAEAIHIVGWRGYLASVRLLRCSQTSKRGFAEDYACIFGGNGEPGKTASRNCADVAYQSSTRRLQPDRRRDSAECRDIPPFNRRYATPISTRSVFPESMSPPKLNLVEPPWYGPVCSLVWGAALRGVPLSDQSC
jgi:hypothetical protein